MACKDTQWMASSIWFMESQLTITSILIVVSIPRYQLNVLTNLNGRVRVFEASPQRVPQVQELVGEEKTIVLIRLILWHLVGSSKQKSFKRIASTSNEMRSLLSQSQRAPHVPAWAETNWNELMKNCDQGYKTSNGGNVLRNESNNDR